MATQLAEIFVGIDVSKDGLDVAVWGRTKAWWFANDTAGWADLVARVAGWTLALLVVEASGGWELPLVAELAAAGQPVAVVNPTRVRACARSIGQLAKTDRLNAKVLAHFAQAIRPPVRPLRSQAQEHLVRLVTRRRQVVATRCNPAIRTFYQCLLTAGKEKKVTLTACMRKLLVILNAILKAQQSWQYQPRAV